MWQTLEDEEVARDEEEVAGLGACVSFAEDYLLLSLLVFLSFALVLSLFAVLLLQNQLLSLWTCNANINLMARFSSSLASHEMRPRVPFLIEDGSQPLLHGSQCQFCGKPRFAIYMLRPSAEPSPFLYVLK